MFLPDCCFSLTTADLQTELIQPGPRSLKKVYNPKNNLTDWLFMILKKTRAIPKLRFKKPNKKRILKNMDRTVQILVFCVPEMFFLKG